LNLTAKKEKSRKKYFYIWKTAAKGAVVILTTVVILTAPAVGPVIAFYSYRSDVIPVFRIRIRFFADPDPT
jgi:hypothetical protein